MYGKIDNGKVVDIYYSKPQWYYDNGSIITDEDLIKENIFPIDEINNDVQTQDLSKGRIIRNSKQNLVIDYENNKITNFFTFVPYTLHQVYESKVAELNIIKSIKTFVDMSYVFPDGKIGHIQLRNQTDLDNINALYSDATNSVTNNIDKVFSFKDRENNPHSMSPQEMSDMCALVRIHTDAIFSEYWDIKHKGLEELYIGSANEAEKINAIISFTWN